MDARPRKGHYLPILLRGNEYPDIFRDEIFLVK
jgi:hypothetical protein